jgi:hypothetical protein
MAEYQLRIANPRPYFAELPYYAWGRVNYDSVGDCRNPLDRSWTWIWLLHRCTRERVNVTSEKEVWKVAGDEPPASRIAFFLNGRCNAVWLPPTSPPTMADWNHEQAAARASLVARTFENDLLAPFAIDHSFWGSWKWIDWHGTEFTWVGRWIMDAVIRNDPRAVNLCISWLREGTCSKSQSAALRYALSRFTGLAYATDRKWVHWYYKAGGRTEFPEPDINAWFTDLKAIYGE